MRRTGQKYSRRSMAAFLALTLLLLSLKASLSLGQEVESIDELWLLHEELFSPVAWFPDGEALLVRRAGEVLDITSGKAQQLTELWILPLDGSAPSAVTENGVLPSISNDGQKLAYLAYAGPDQWSRIVHHLSTDQKEHLGVQAWPAGRHLEWVSDVDVAWNDAEEIHGFRVPSPDGVYLAGVDAHLGSETTLWVENVVDGTRRVYLDRQLLRIDGLSWGHDSRQIIFSRLAPGTAITGEICWLNLNTGDLVPLFPGRQPLWSPDGRWIAFEWDRRVWLAHLEDGRPPQRLKLPGTGDAAAFVAEHDGDVSITGQLIPPEHIRVYHSQGNYNYNPNCRPHVPVGQIDEIPFEEYVKRVVPHEIGVSSPMEAIKAQALAARSYAWWFVLRRSSHDYDVTDWTDFQYMCDATYATTNAAVDATRGQYIAYNGSVILAEYSAQNSTPTRSRSGYPYMQSIHDEVGFGETRWGHGRGVSQIGARRWAANYGWNYEQILAHYYFDVTIERPANSGSQPLSPAGAIVRPLSHSFITSRWVNLRASASDPDGDVSSVDFYATWKDTAGNAVTQHLGAGVRQFNGWHLLWDVAGLPDQPRGDQTVKVTARARDAGGREGALKSIMLGIDRQLPGGVVTSPPYSAQRSVLLSVSPGDAGASTMAGLLLGNGWIWEGENLYHQTNSGALVNDADAWNGKAWVGRAGQHVRGAWYGPYTHDLAEGQAYRAIFRLKTNDNSDPREIAILDVADKGGLEILGIRRLHGVDFLQSNRYQEFSVDFWYKKAEVNGLEFRIHWAGIRDLYFDRVLVTAYPIPLASSVSWELPESPGIYTVTAKFADRAGNVSSDQMMSIELLAENGTPSPTATPTSTPTPTAAPTATQTPTPTASQQEIVLRQGWNLVSFRVQPADQRVETLVAGLLPALEVIMGFDCLEGAKSFYHQLPAELNTLRRLEAGKGYWVRVNQPTTWRLEGTQLVANTPQSLCRGWNLIGFLPAEGQEVATALSSCGDSVEAVLGFHLGEGVSFYPTLPPAMNTLTELRPGYGYWVRTSRPVILTFPTP